MSCIGQNQTHLEETDSKPINQSHSIQDQSHLMALTSEWGHSVFEEKMKQEQGDQRYGGYLTPKIGTHHQESLSEEPRQLPSSELRKEKDFSQLQQIEVVTLDNESDVSSDRTLRCRRARLSEEEIAAKRAAQAAAQREVRRRRREKMTEEEVQAKLAALAASQREARKKQRDKMTEEELQLRRTISAITQREIRKRRLSSMTEEELKAYRAREAARQKELRQRKRMEMSEEELKSLKAKEAAASAARRIRRLEKEGKSSCLTGVEPDPSPS